ncbi:hypothetical protein [Shimia abyssi]|uniref:Uncharacterized protein n=1 Tax=Shimia abyssi TaxID=1662395 RepID=A0A2P8FFD4_9RHOB|nr:hypothetical protein [Shimia abyssi]PSL20431.1 hypothetical protein CLV88_10372 [Shimia abyssi]
MRFDIAPQSRHLKWRDIGPVEQRGMHRILGYKRVIQNECIVGGIEHIGRIAVTVAKIDAACLGEAAIPWGQVWGKRGLRCQRDHCCTGGGNRKRSRRIATWARTIKHDAFEFVEKSVVGQAIEIGVYSRIAEP